MRFPQKNIFLNCSERFRCTNLHESESFGVQENFEFHILWNPEIIGIDIYDMTQPVGDNIRRKNSGQALSEHCRKGPLKYVINAWLESVQSDTQIFLVANLTERIFGGFKDLIEIILQTLSKHQPLVVLIEVPQMKMIATRHKRELVKKNLEKIKSYIENSETDMIHWVFTDVQIDDPIKSHLNILDLRLAASPKTFVIATGPVGPSLLGLYPAFLSYRAVEIIDKKPMDLKGNNADTRVWFFNRIEPLELIEMMYLKLTNPDELYAYNF